MNYHNQNYHNHNQNYHNYQNIALCRFIYLWVILFLFNIVSFSPLVLIILIILLESYSQFFGQKRNMLKGKSFFIDNNANKHIGILMVDVVVLLLILAKNQNLFIYENTLFFILYNFILFIMYKTDIVTLHNKHLYADDIKYSNESYIEYSKRIWNSGVIQTILITVILLSFIHYIKKLL